MTDYRQKYCDDCEGDGASWIEGKNGVKWTVRDVRPTGKRWLCSMCRQYPGHGIKAYPRSIFANQQTRRAA